MSAFFDGWFGDLGEGYIEVRPVSDKENHDPLHIGALANARQSFSVDHPDALFEHVATHHANAHLSGRTGWYWGISPRIKPLTRREVEGKTVWEGGSTDDVDVYVGAWADIDAHSDEDRPKVQHAFEVCSLLEQMGFNPTFRIRSGGGDGFHIYYKFVEPVDTVRGRQIVRKLALLMQSDPKVADPPRIMRIPGTIHSKTGNLIPVTIEEQNEVAYHATDFEEAVEDLSERFHVVLDDDRHTQYRFYDGLSWAPMPIEVVRNKLPAVCARFGKFVANPSDVNEAEWAYMSSTIRSLLGDDGFALFDEWSQGYQNGSEHYTYKKTLQKWQRTGVQHPPRCATYQEVEDRPECRSCPFSNQGKSPNMVLRAEHGKQLGQNRPFGAPSYVEAIQEGYESDGVEWLQEHKDLVNRAQRFEAGEFRMWAEGEGIASLLGGESEREPETVDEDYLDSLGTDAPPHRLASPSRPTFTVYDGGATAVDLKGLPPDVRKKQMVQNAESVIERLFDEIGAEEKDASQFSDPAIAYAFAVLQELNTPAFQKLSAVAKESLKRAGMNVTVFSRKIRDQIKAVKVQLQAVNIPAKGKEFNRIGNKYYPADVQMAPLPTKYPDAYYYVENGKMFKREWKSTKEAVVEISQEVSDTIVAVVNLREPYRKEAGLDQLPRILHVRIKETRGWVDLNIEVAETMDYRKLNQYTNHGLPLTTNNATAMQGYLSESASLICRCDELEDLITTYAPHMGWIGRDPNEEWDYLVLEGAVGGTPVQYMQSPFAGDANVIGALSVRRGDAKEQAKNIIHDLLDEPEMATFIGFAVGSPLTFPLSAVGNLGMRGFVVELVSGEGATGKTTASKMAMSLFGGVSENENLDILRLTMNSFAPRMYAGGGVPAFYDEPQATRSTHKQNEGDLKTILFEIAKGKSKVRGSALGANRMQTDFGGLLLMTANASYADLSADEVGDGEMQRLISLRPRLENSTQRGEKMEQMEKGWSQNAGSLHPYLAKKYLDWGRTKKDREKLGELHQMYAERLKQLIKLEAAMKEVPWDPTWDGKLTRFAKLNVVGILGIAALAEVISEMLPDRKEEAQRLVHLVSAHLSEVIFRQILSGERLVSPAERARDYLEEVILSRGHEICRFGHDARESDKDRTEWIGYWKGDNEIAFLPSKLRDILSERGFAVSQVFKTWSETGVIRKGKDQTALAVKIPQLGNKAIKAIVYKPRD